MLSTKETQRLRKAIEKDLAGSVEHTVGECNVVFPLDDGEDKEVSFDWRNGKATVCDSPDEDEDGPEIEYVFRVRVELVAVVQS